MTRLSVAVLALSLGAGCASAVDRRAATVQAKIDEARRSEAYRCAPVELAKAEVQLELARFHLDKGDGPRALSHVGDADVAAMDAIARARPCAPNTRPDDLDGDGVADAADLCRKLPGRVDRNGCPDTDGDGIFDDLDRCRFEPEDRDGFRDDDGCPDLDDDDDGIADVADACRTEPGPVENRGCPGQAPAVAAVPVAPAGAGETGRVKLGPDRLEIAEKLRFKPFAGELLAASHEVLREVAAVLKANPDVKLRIEGHTDSKGNAQVNNWMSRERAKAVKNFLVNEGVSASRLASVGRGFSQPLAPNDTEAGREANRRIELVVIAR